MKSMVTTDANAPVVTSLGIISPYGLGLEAFLSALASGEALPAPARCPEVDLKEYLPAEKTYLDRCSELALVAAALALREGGLLDENRLLRLPLSRRERGPGGEAPSPLPSREAGRGVGATGETPVAPGAEGAVQARALQPERIGLGLGTAYGCLDSMYANTQRVQTRGARLASPLLFMHSFVNAPASLIAIEWGLQGPGATFTDGGLSAASALYWACDLLRRGEVDMMLVGGVEALGEPLLRSMVGGRWSIEGTGETGVAWEAAAIFLLERAEVAEGRGVRSLAQIGEVLAPTPLPSPAGRGWRAWRAPGEVPYAFGAHFALLMAEALGDLAGEPSGSRVSVQQAEGARTAKTVLIKP
jgi:hypothetical protein